LADEVEQAAGMMDTLDSDAEILEMAARLRSLAEGLIERSRAAEGDALELLARGVALQRAAFVLQAEPIPAAVDLRDRQPGSADR
jgi:hypothetical protein